MSDSISLYDPEGRRKYLNAEERRRFLLATQEVESLHDRTFLETLLYSGCRISEALALTRQQVDYSNRTLVFKTLKQHGAKRFRSVPVPGKLVEDLVRLMDDQELDLEGRIWRFCRTTGWGRVKRVMEHAGISGAMATCKGLRHSLAITCIQQRIDLFTVQKWLGHARSETTGVYLAFVGEDERDLAQRTWDVLESP